VEARLVVPLLLQTLDLRNGHLSLGDDLFKELWKMFVERSFRWFQSCVIVVHVMGESVLLLVRC